MFDSHCHLQDTRILGCVGDVINKARNVGVGWMLCCGSDVVDWADVARIGAGYGGVICAYGVHPWYVNGVVNCVDINNTNEINNVNNINSTDNIINIKDVNNAHDEWMAALEGYLTRDSAAAVGEIGLDHAVNPRNDDVQRGIFVRQLEIADRYQRPVSIHCRKAWGDLLSILRDRGGLRHGGAIHSYSGPPDLVDELQKLGCYISFSGSILIPGNKRAAESLKRVSPDRLLAETDAPDILPPGIPPPHNEPANLPLVITKISEILGETSEKTASLTCGNALRLFAGSASAAASQTRSPAPAG